MSSGMSGGGARLDRVERRLGDHRAVLDGLPRHSEGVVVAREHAIDISHAEATTSARG